MQLTSKGLTIFEPVKRAKRVIRTLLARISAASSGPAQLRLVYMVTINSDMLPPAMCGDVTPWPYSVFHNG